MEASLTCAVCLCLFEEPVTLPLCSHNFCKRCVLECAAPGRSQQPPQLQVGEAQVSCPLCRKISIVAGGASNLPVNTTLAEVVKLIRPGGGGGEAEAPGVKGSACPKHPGRSLQLYCRMCRQTACGQCVAEDHRGIFHAINLTDIVYQEEKLMFFSNLKKLREVDGRLMKEISAYSNDIEGISEDVTDMITTQFDEISRILDLKKKQLLQELENWTSKKKKEHQVWKQTKDSHKKTIENFLKDCEKIVDECDPEYFLKVACDLNTRMKTQLDLITIASHYERTPNSTSTEIDIKAAIDAISALHLTGDLSCFTDPFTEKNKDINGMFIFKDSVKRWKKPKNAVSEEYCPVLGEDDSLIGGLRIYGRYMSISAMSKFKGTSHEELRQDYYETYRRSSSDCKTQTLPKVNSGKSSGQFAVSNMHGAVKNTKEERRLKPFRLLRQTAFDETNTLNPGSLTLNLYHPVVNEECNEKRSQKMNGVAATSENSVLLQTNLGSAPSTPSAISGIIQTPLGNLTAGVAVSPVLPLTTSNASVSSVKKGLTAFCFTPSSTGAAFNFKIGKSKDESCRPDFIFGKSGTENVIGNTTTGPTCSAAVSTIPVATSVSAITKSVFSFTFGSSESKLVTTKANGVLNASPPSFLVSQPDKGTELNMFPTTRKTTESAVRKSEDLSRLKLPAVELCGQTAACTIGCTESKGTVKEETDSSKTLLLSATNLFSSSLNSSFQEPKSTQKFSFGHRVQNMSSPVTVPMNAQSKIKPTGMVQSVDEQCIIPAHTMDITSLSTNSFTSLGELNVEAVSGSTVDQNNPASSAACNTLFSCLFPSETSHFPSFSSTAAISVSHTKEDSSAAKNYKAQGDLGEFLRQQFGLESSSQVSNDLPTPYDQPSGNSADKMEVTSVLLAAVSDLDESDKESSLASSIASDESQNPNNEDRISFKCTAKSIDSSSIRE